MYKDIPLLKEHNAFTRACISQSYQSTPLLCLREQSEKYHAKCIQTTVKSPVSVKVCGAMNSRGMSLQEKVNGNMDSEK